MVPSLIFWGVLLSVWIFYAMFAVGTSGMKGDNDKFITLLTLLAVLTSVFIDKKTIFDFFSIKSNVLFFVSVFYIACYLFIVISCILMKGTKKSSRTSNSFFRDFEPWSGIDETHTFKVKTIDI